MMLKMEALPKGFRFRPTDQELVNHYLRLKINGHHSSVQVIPEVDVCKREPWDLPALSVIKSEDPEWYFFCPRDRKYPNGHRSNRATEAGYWKATGKDRTIKHRKSLPSGHSSTQLVGMKKTLVFYKGRAPKGERTNWIMHEYRATEPDLDGSGPGKGDYVLCRLFHKTNDKIDNSNSDEVEPTGSSPSTGKSSPDVTSDLFQEPAALGTEKKGSENVRKQWAHEVDHLTSLMQVPSGSNTASEVHTAVSEIPMFDEFTNNQIDNKILSNPQSHNYADSGACIGSPFTYDFGYDPNGLHFQDGTSEQDASLSELLNDLQNVDNYFDMNSTTGMNFAAASDNLMPEQINGLDQAPVFSEASHFQIHDKSDAEMAQLQLPSVQGQTSAAFIQLEPSTGSSFSQYADKEDDPFASSFISSHYKAESFFDSHMIKDGSTRSFGTPIKIRSRSPRNQLSSVNTVTHGTASKRIHLVVRSGSNSICGENNIDGNSTNEKESEALVAQSVKNIDGTSKSHEHGHPDEMKVIAQACDRSLESPAKNCDEKGSTKMGFKTSSTLSSRKVASYLNVYIVSIYLVMIISVVSLGFWKCRSLSAPYD